MSWRRRISIVSFAFATYLFINKDTISNIFLKKQEISTQMIIQEQEIKKEIEDYFKNIQAKQNEQDQSKNQQFNKNYDKQVQNKKVHQQENKKQQVKQQEKQVKEQKKEKTYNRYLNKFPQYDMKQQNDDKFILIVADADYTNQFEQVLMRKINDIISQRRSKQPLKIYRMNLKQNKKALQQNQVTIKEDTIFILKNPYHKQLIDIDFNMFMDNPKVVPVLLSQSHFINQNNYKSTYIDIIKDMSSSQAYLFYVINPKNQTQINQGVLTIKSIQCQLSLNNLQNIRVFAIDTETMKQAQLLQNPLPKTLHLMRKSNQYTFGTPNRQLFGNIPFYFIEDINLFDRKSKQILIRKYLEKIQIFNTFSGQYHHILSLIIDKNFIDPTQQKQILSTFAELRQNKKFPGVQFTLTFSKIDYTGKQQQYLRNKRWMVKMLDYEQISQQYLVLEVKQRKDLQQLKINQKQFGKRSFQYLYKQPQINTSLISNFIERVLSKQYKQFYKTEKIERLQKTNKLTGDNYHKNIFGDQTYSHLVFQYSNHCPACQVLSPLIDQFSSVCKSMPVLKLKVHSINSEKNRVKGQQYTPYTPNISYYSQNWKNKKPIYYPVMYNFNRTGIMGLYNFIEITESLKKIDIKKFQQIIENSKLNKVKISDF